MTPKHMSRTSVNILLVLVLGLILIAPKSYLEPTVIGAVVTKVFVTGLAYNRTCSVDMITGWNLVSMPCKVKSKGFDTVLAGISADLGSIHTYYAPDAADPWKSYNPGLPGWVLQDLSEIDEKKGYWINMKAPNTFALNGTVNVPNSIFLNRGWNLVAYRGNRSLEAGFALSSIGGALSAAYAYDASDTADRWKEYVPGSDTNDLDIIYLGKGYWINVMQDAEWWVG
ncbi:MAG: hypothetical protein ABH879_07195 [archaeon]